MSSFEADVGIEDVAIRDTNVSAAVDEPARAMILDMLAETEMTVEDIHEDLVDRGIDRTENTVRHHVNELRDAGLIEVARLEERRGGTLKYYRANTIVLSYSVPESARERIDEMATEIAPAVDSVIRDLVDDHGGELEEIAASMAPCEHCRNQKYEMYLLLTVLRRAFVKTLDTDSGSSTRERTDSG